MYEGLDIHMSLDAARLIRKTKARCDFCARIFAWLIIAIHFQYKFIWFRKMNLFLTIAATRDTILCCNNGNKKLLRCKVINFYFRN